MITRRSLLSAPLAIAGLGRADRQAPPDVPPELLSAVAELADAVALLEALDVEHDALLERSRSGDRAPLSRWYKEVNDPAVARMRVAEGRFRAALEAADLSGVVVAGRVWADLNQCIPVYANEIPESVIAFDLADVAGLGGGGPC